MGGNAGVYLGFLKGKVAVSHFAVYKPQIFAVAKGLSSDNAAVFKGYVLGIPGKVLSLDGAVFDGYIFGVPECVLSVKIT